MAKLLLSVSELYNRFGATLTLEKFYEEYIERDVKEENYPFETPEEFQQGLIFGFTPTRVTDGCKLVKTTMEPMNSKSVTYLYNDYQSYVKRQLNYNKQLEKERELTKQIGLLTKDMLKNNPQYIQLMKLKEEFKNTILCKINL